jgi:hypothetical protein
VNDRQLLVAVHSYLHIKGMRFDVAKYLKSQVTRKNIKILGFFN